MNKSLFFVIVIATSLLVLATTLTEAKNNNNNPLSSLFFGGNKNTNNNNNDFIRAGPPAPATLETSSSFFNKLISDVIPAINQLARNLVIPAGGSEKQHFTYHDIRFSSFDLGTVDFIFNAPNEVEVRMTELKFSIPSTEFHLYDRIIFEIHCAGYFDVDVALSASFKMNLVDKDGKLDIAGTTDVSIDYQKFDPHLKFDHFFCKLGGDIIGLFTGGLDKLIKNLVEKDLAPGIQKALTGALQKAFAKLPVELTGNPQCVGGVLQIPINLDSLLKKQQFLNTPPQLMSQQQQQQRHQFKSFSARDLGIILPDTSLDTLLHTLKTLGKLGPFNKTDEKLTTDLFKLLLPAAYNACQNCPLNFRVDFAKAPTAIFSNNNATLNIQNLTLDLHAQNASTHAMVPLFTLGLVVDLSLDNFTVSGIADNVIHFDIGLQALQFSQVSSHIGTVPVAALNLISNIIKTVVIPDINKNSKGLDLNDLFKGTNITVAQVEVDLTSNGVMKAGLDVNIKS